MNSSDSNSSLTDLSYDGATIQFDMAPSLKEVRKNSMKRLGNSNSSLSESETSTHNLSVSNNHIIFKKPLFKKPLNLNSSLLNDSTSSSAGLPKTILKNASIKNRKESLQISQCLENSLNDSSSKLKIENVSKWKSTNVMPAKKSLSLSSSVLEQSLTENVINLKDAFSRQKENRKSLKFNCSSFEKSASPVVEGSFDISHSSGNDKTCSEPVQTLIDTEQSFCDKDVGLLSDQEPSGIEIEVNAVEKIKQMNSTTINSKSDTGVLQCESSEDKNDKIFDSLNISIVQSSAANVINTEVDSSNNIEVTSSRVESFNNSVEAKIKQNISSGCTQHEVICDSEPNKIHDSIKCGRTSTETEENNFEQFAVRTDFDEENNKKGITDDFTFPTKESEISFDERQHTGIQERPLDSRIEKSIEKKVSPVIRDCQSTIAKKKSCIDETHSNSNLSCNSDKVCDGGKSNDNSDVIDIGTYSPKALLDHRKGADKSVQELKTTSDDANINEGKEVAMENSALFKAIHDNYEPNCELAETKMSAHNLNTTYTLPAKNSCLNVTYTVSEDHPKMPLDRPTDKTEIVSDKNVDEYTETNDDENFVNESNFDIRNKMKNRKKKIVMKSLKSLSDSCNDLDRSDSVPERGWFGINKKIGRKSLHLSEVYDSSQPSKFDDTTPLRSDREDTNVVSMVKQQIIGTTACDGPVMNISVDTPDSNESCHNLIEADIDAQHLTSRRSIVTATEEQEKYSQDDFEITSSQESTNDVKNIFKKNIIRSKKSLVLNHTSMENTVEETFKDCIKKPRVTVKRSLETTNANTLCTKNSETDSDKVSVQGNVENIHVANNSVIVNDNIQAENENILLTKNYENNCDSHALTEEKQKSLLVSTLTDGDNSCNRKPKKNVSKKRRTNSSAVESPSDEKIHEKDVVKVTSEDKSSPLAAASKDTVSVQDISSHKVNKSYSNEITSSQESTNDVKNIFKKNIIRSKKSLVLNHTSMENTVEETLKECIKKRRVTVKRSLETTNADLLSLPVDKTLVENGELSKCLTDNSVFLQVRNENTDATNNGEITNDNIFVQAEDENIRASKTGETDCYTISVQADDGNKLAIKNNETDLDNILPDADKGDILATNTSQLDCDNIVERVIDENIHATKSDVITNDNILAENEDIPSTKNGEIERDNIFLETENENVLGNDNGEIDNGENTLCTKNSETDSDKVSVQGNVENIYVANNKLIVNDNIQAENKNILLTKNYENNCDSHALTEEKQFNSSRNRFTVGMEASIAQAIPDNNVDNSNDPFKVHVSDPLNDEATEQLAPISSNDDTNSEEVSDKNIHYKESVNLNFRSDSLVDEKNVTNKSSVALLNCNTTTQVARTEILQNNSENTINREPVTCSSRVLDSEDSFENNCSLESSHSLKFVFKNKIGPRKSLHLNNSSLKNSVDGTLKIFEKNRCSEVAFKRVNEEEIFNRNQDYVCADLSQKDSSYSTDKSLSEKRCHRSVLQNPPERSERSVHFTESENIVPTRDETVCNSASVDNRSITREEVMPDRNSSLKKRAVEKSDSLTSDRCILNTQTLNSTNVLRNTSSSQTKNVEEIAVTNEVIRENSLCCTNTFLECTMKKDFEDGAIDINKSAHEFINISLTDALAPINITSTRIDSSGKDREMLVCEGSNSKLQLLRTGGNSEPAIEPAIEPCDDPVTVTPDNHSSNKNIAGKRSSSYEKSVLVSTLTDGDNSCNRKPKKNVSKKRRSNSSAVESPSDEKINEKDVKVTSEDKSSPLAAASKDTVSVQDISSHKVNKSYSNDLIKNNFKVPNSSPVNRGRKRSDHCQEKLFDKEMATAGPSTNDQSLNWTVDVSRIPAEVKCDYNLRSKSHSTPLILKNTAYVTSGNTDKMKKSKKKKSVTFANSYVNPVNISTPIDSCSETDAPLMHSLADVSVICGEGMQGAGCSGMKPKSSTPNPKRRVHERSKNNRLKEKPVDASRKSSSESNISIQVGPKASDDVTLPRRGRSSRTDSYESNKRTSLIANSRAEVKSSDELAAVNESKKNRSVQVSKTYVLSSSNFSSEISSVSKANKTPNKTQTTRCSKTASSLQKLNYDRVQDDTFLETSVVFPPKKKQKTCSLTKFDSKEDHSIVSSRFRSSVKGERALKTITNIGNVGNYLRESFSTISIDDSVDYQMAKRPRLQTTSKSFSRKSIHTDSNTSFKYGGNCETNEKSYFSNDDGLPLGYSISDEEENAIPSYDELKRNHPWLPSLIWKDRMEQDEDRSNLTFQQSSLLSTFQRPKNRPKTIKIKYPKKKMAKPAPWANKLFYKYLFDTLKPIYGIEHKKKSEDFVLFLHPYVESVKLLKHKKDYSNFVLIVKEKAKEIGLCKDIWDFWDFCKFLPYEFKAKAIETGDARYDSVIVATEPF